MKSIQWKQRSIGGNSDKCFIIAEAGTAHQGKEEKAFQLIDSAKRAGADCIKFQIVFADEIVHPDAGEIQLPGGAVPIYQRFKELEKDFSFFSALKKYAKKKEIIFLCSVFGSESAALYKKLGAEAVKIASPELNHFPLLQTVAQWNCPVLLSTGVSLLGDIEKALALSGNEVLLFHCITSYPAKEEEYNLKLVSAYRSLFDIPVGVSDHSKDPLLVPGIAVTQKAAAIEKHITLSPGNEGLDDPFALTQEDFCKMVDGVRKIEKMESSAGLQLLVDLYGKERVGQVLGSGKKQLAMGEAENYFTTRRSILAVADIKEGELFIESNTALLRSEKNLEPGLPPDYYKNILGRRARKNIPSGKGIDWDDVLS